jgi:hypothetical protein
MDQLRDLLDAVPQRGLFIFKHITQASLCSLVFGLSGGMLTAAVAPIAVGPLAPYLVCSWMGFGLSTVTTWRREKKAAIQCAQNYPNLLEHHLTQTMGGPSPFPHVRDTPVRTLGLGHMTWLILARQTAQKDLEAIAACRSEALVNKYAESAGRLSSDDYEGMSRA